MQRYIDQLLRDLSATAREHRSRATPLAGRFFLDEEERSEAEFATHITEVERYLAGESDGTLFQALGLSREAFPPVDRLSHGQVSALVTQILASIADFGVVSEHPAEIPAHLLYPQLLGMMGRDDYLETSPGGFTHHEYCYYEPSDCPWPRKYCSCISMLQAQGLWEEE